MALRLLPQTKARILAFFQETYPYFCGDAASLCAVSVCPVPDREAVRRGRAFLILIYMFRKEINFDRFVRGLLLICLVALAVAAINYLSGVLLPFFVAWVLAYMLFPVVKFLQYTCRLRSRLLCIGLTLVLVGGVVGGLLYLCIPPMMAELGHLKDLALQYIERGANNATIPAAVQEFVNENASKLRLHELLREKDLMVAVKSAAPKVGEVLWSTAGMAVSFVSSLIALLYLLFLLIDYEKMTTGWLAFVPRNRRPFIGQLVGDIAHGLSGYFRGQALVALSNCIMFSVGFALIGFPVPVGLGCFIGIISFVPYLQLVGFLPATLLALLKAAETDTNFWWLIGGVCLVYIVVQIIQDALVTPKIMGKIMGLSPAIILLSLSVWGYMLGLIGLIVALPATTLIFAYYKRYIIGEEDSTEAR